MTDLFCKTCGGRLEINIGSDTAVCDSCGLVRRLEPGEVAGVTAAWRAALTDMGSGTRQGYKDAIDKFRSLSFVAGSNDRIAECQERIRELDEAQERRENSKKKTGSAGLGIVLIIVAVLILAAIIAGAVYLIINIVHGTLTPTARWIAVAAGVLVIILAVVGKLSA